MAKNRKPKIGAKTAGVISCETARVFTTLGKNGNGLGVVTAARGLSAATMQQVARTLGFSETSFVLPATGKGADYRVRFFTPEKEIPFAGHPSLGTLFVLQKRGLVPHEKSYVQQVGKRKIALCLMPDGRITMAQGKPRFLKPISRALAAQVLGLDESAIAGEPMAVSTGLAHIIIPLASMAHLKLARIRQTAYEKARKICGADCVMPFFLENGSARCRMFAPALGITEDPATGSGCGPLAAYAVKAGLIAVPPGGCAQLRVTQGIKKVSTLFASVRTRGNAIVSVDVGGYCALSAKRKVRPGK